MPRLLNPRALLRGATRLAWRATSSSSSIDRFARGGALPASVVCRIQWPGSNPLERKVDSLVGWWEGAWLDQLLGALGDANYGVGGDVTSGWYLLRIFENHFGSFGGEADLHGHTSSLKCRILQYIIELGPQDGRQHTLHVN